MRSSMWIPTRAYHTCRICFLGTRRVKMTPTVEKFQPGCIDFFPSLQQCRCTAPQRFMHLAKRLCDSVLLSVALSVVLRCLQIVSLLPPPPRPLCPLTQGVLLLRLLFVQHPPPLPLLPLPHLNPMPHRLHGHPCSLDLHLHDGNLPGNKIPSGLPISHTLCPLSLRLRLRGPI